MIKFYPNCTLPSSSPAFVLAPNTRSTLEIIWNCLATLLLCTWSILHLNVPPQITPQTKWQKTKRWIFFSTTKFKWMVITLLAPETIMGFASSALWSALDNNRKLKELARKDSVAWSTAHSFYANMGGFVIVFSEYESQETTGGQDIRDTINGNRPRDTIGPSQQINEVLETDDFANHLSQPDSLSLPLRALEAQSSYIRSQRATSSMMSNLRSSRVGSRQQDLGTEIHEEGGTRRTVSQRDNNNLSKVSYLDIINQNRRRTISNRVFDNMFRYLSMDRLHLLGNPHWKFDQDYWEMASDLHSTLPHSKSVSSTAYLQGNTWVLGAAQIALARELDIIDCLPNLSDDELADKNKGNLLVKGLAILQIIWMMIQLIWRRINDKPASQLEVMTLSFAVCAFIIYVLMWSRPQGVETPTVIQGNRVSKKGMKSLAQVQFGIFWFRRDLYTMPNHVVHEPNMMLLGGGIGAILFGLLHLLAWDFTFPTEAEKTLWRVSSLVTFISPVMSIFVSKIIPFGQIWFTLYMLLAVLAFVIARLFLLVESFRSLYFLPPDVFVTTWASNIPHPF